jgi:hypothetical protein
MIRPQEIEEKSAKFGVPISSIERDYVQNCRVSHKSNSMNDIHNLSQRTMVKMIVNDHKIVSENLKANSCVKVSVWCVPYEFRIKNTFKY